PAQIARLALTIAHALDFIHERSIVHRDLKPANILLDSRADAYLSDFGIAREFGETSTLTMNTPEGTLPYMSPEQLDLGRISPRSDVYSLGVLLFEMLTGKLPLGGQFILAIKQRQTHEQLEDPSTINPAIPTGVAAILRELTSLES